MFHINDVGVHHGQAYIIGITKAFQIRCGIGIKYVFMNFWGFGVENMHLVFDCVSYICEGL